MKYIVFLLFIILFPINANETLIMVSGNSPTETFQGRLLNNIYTEVFNRLGLSWEYQEYPGKRRDALLDNGLVDGELSRVLTYGNDHTDLVRVNESPFSISMSMFGNNNLTINNIEELKGLNFRIGVLRGSKQPNQILDDLISRGFVDKKDKYEFNTYESGLSMLFNNRIDLILGNEFGIIDQIQLKNSPGFHKVLEISSYPIYSYLHKKNTSLVPLIEETLKEIKLEGLIDKYIQQAGNSEEKSNGNTSQN